MYAEIGTIGQWKIGISKNNPELRFNQLKTANPNLLKISAIYKVYNQLGWRIEAGLKRYYKIYKIRDEWFKYEALNEKEFLNRALIIENNYLILDQAKQNNQLYNI